MAELNSVFVSSGVAPANDFFKSIRTCASHWENWPKLVNHCCCFFALSNEIKGFMGAYAAFDGFSELRAEHTLLLREYHATGGTKDLIEKVLVFIQRGCQSGEILDGDDEREGAQRTLD